MDYRQQIRRVVFSAAVQGIYYLRNILLIPVLTRILGPELYGVWGKSSSIINIGFPLIALGAMSGMQRFLPASKGERRSSLFWNCAAVVTGGGAVFTAGLVLGGELLSPFLYKAHPEAVTTWLLAGVGAATAVAALSHSVVCYYQYSERPVRYALATSARSLMVFAALAALWLSGVDKTPWLPVAALVLGWGATAFFGMLFIAGDAAPRLDRNVLREMVVFGFPLLPMTMVMWVVNCADKYLLTELIAENADAVVGVYEANYQLGGLVALLYSPLHVFRGPAVNRAWDAGDRAAAGHLTRQTIKYGLVLMLPAVMTAPILADTGMRYIAGADFRAAPEVIFLVMTGYVFNVIGHLAMQPLLLEKRTWIVFVVTAVAAALNIVLNLLLIPLAPPWGGMTGAALATTASFFLYLVLARILTWRVREFGLGWTNALRIVAPAVGCAALVRAWNPSGPAALIAAVVTSGSLYCAALVLVGVVKRHEISTAWQALGGAVAGIGSLLRRRADEGDDDRPSAD